MNELQLLQKRQEIYEKIIKETKMNFIGSLEKGIVLEYEGLGITIEVKIAKNLSNFQDRQMRYKIKTIVNNDPYVCPHCGTSEDIEFIAENKPRGIEKYSCNTCSKTYTVLYQPRIYDILGS